MARPETPDNSNLREMVKIYPEIDLAVEMVDPVTIEAKRRLLFSTAEVQLVTYLAMLRELRMQAGKKNTVTQGFYTDGYQYCFMAINADGVVESSPIYDVMNREGGKTIFNFIVTILESAMKSSPIVTPTKSAEQQEKEINNFTGEVWSKVYVPYLSSPRLEVDGDDEEVMDLPPLMLED